MSEQRKASYSAALMLWRRHFGGQDARWKPSGEAFGLSPEEAAEVEERGHSLGGGQ